MAGDKIREQPLTSFFFFEFSYFSKRNKREFRGNLPFEWIPYCQNVSCTHVPSPFGDTCFLHGCLRLNLFQLFRQRTIVSSEMTVGLVTLIVPGCFVASSFLLWSPAIDLIHMPKPFRPLRLVFPDFVMICLVRLFFLFSFFFVSRFAWRFSTGILLEVFCGNLYKKEALWGIFTKWILCVDFCTMGHAGDLFQSGISRICWGKLVGEFLQKDSLGCAGEIPFFFIFFIFFLYIGETLWEIVQ